mgnify:CR=1 FL=1
MPDVPAGSMLPFRWVEEETASQHGEGISRPRPGNQTREYRLIVYPNGSKPLKWTMRAESKRHAIRYAEARWPGAVVEVA